VSLLQEGLLSSEKELAEARTRLAEEQSEAGARAAALTEQSERLHAEAARLEAARRAWAEGEADRRRAGELLEEARAEAARVKVRALGHAFMRCTVPCSAQVQVQPHLSCCMTDMRSSWPPGIAIQR
jgi:hypothetical protein